jgi:hypothetical protein
MRSAVLVQMKGFGWRAWPAQTRHRKTTCAHTSAGKIRRRRRISRGEKPPYLEKTEQQTVCRPCWPLRAPPILMCSKGRRRSARCGLGLGSLEVQRRRPRPTRLCRPGAGASTPSAAPAAQGCYGWQSDDELPPPAMLTLPSPTPASAQTHDRSSRALLAERSAAQLPARNLSRSYRGGHRSSAAELHGRWSRPPQTPRSRHRASRAKDARDGGSTP